jgi:hypothetical protein
MMSAAVVSAGTGTIQFAAPAPLFDLPASDVGTRFDVAPDGRFFMLQNVGAGSSEAPSLTVVLNWVEELERGAPIGAQ